MSFLSFVPIIGTIIDRVIPDKNAAEKAKMEMLKLQNDGDIKSMLAQIEINKEEAKHSSIFVAGARPAILWICGIIFGYHYLLYPIIITISALAGFDTTNLPVFDLSAVWPVLGGLLGLGGLRTFEKINNVARKNIKGE